LENRARKDVSDLERARNYSTALADHYGNHLTRMAERLKLSKGWLSKMIKVAGIPDAVIAAFASPDDVQLKPAYPLAQALDDKCLAKTITGVARQVAKEQAARRQEGQPPYPAADVLRRLLHASVPDQGEDKSEPYRYATRHGRTALSVQSANRQGVTIRLHAGSGADTDELVTALRDALAHLDAIGKGLQR
ncbi:MAG TPA: chromosome partitioning protein ParB, partial [Sphingomonas sp.]